VPKIINDLEEKIFEAAFNLFAKKGYNNVTMKAVADEVGIAVGTLYNYYHNKDELFLNVLKQHLNHTFSILNDIIERDCDTNEFITVLYDQAIKIRGFSEEIIRSSIMSHDSNQIINVLKEDLIRIIRELILKIKEKKNLEIPKKDEEKISYLLLLVNIFFAKEFPDERRENLNFISNLVHKLYT
jgi:AcrR family transcriptional regulator